MLMLKLLKFVEFASIDEKLYWRVSSKKSDAIFEIQWNRNLPLPWRFRQSSRLFWQLHQPENLLDAFEKNGLDLDEFKRKLEYTILQQICYAQKIVDDGKELLGNHKVNDALEENRRFLKQLESAIKRISQSKNEPNSAKKRSKPKLRLVEP
jgi:hypothetical protein